MCSALHSITRTQSHHRARPYPWSSNTSGRGLRQKCCAQCRSWPAAQSEFESTQEGFFFFWWLKLGHKSVCSSIAKAQVSIFGIPEDKRTTHYSTNTQPDSQMAISIIHIVSSPIVSITATARTSPVSERRLPWNRLGAMFRSSSGFAHVSMQSWTQKRVDGRCDYNPSKKQNIT